MDRGAALPVRVRPVRPADVPALLSLAAGTSTRSMHARFFIATRTVPARVAAGLADVDLGRHAAVAAWSPTGPVGWAQYDRTGTPGEAEIAVLVTDAWQARGIGPLLLRALVPIARANGFRAFTATTLADNAPARRALRRLWPGSTPSLADGTLRWRLPLDPAGAGPSVDGDHSHDHLRDRPREAHRPPADPPCTITGPRGSPEGLRARERPRPGTSGTGRARA